VLFGFVQFAWTTQEIHPNCGTTYSVAYGTWGHSLFHCVWKETHYRCLASAAASIAAEPTAPHYNSHCAQEKVRQRTFSSGIRCRGGSFVPSKLPANLAPHNHAPYSHSGSNCKCERCLPIIVALKALRDRVELVKYADEGVGALRLVSSLAGRCTTSSQRNSSP
jgi:hypothetical protein